MSDLGVKDECVDVKPKYNIYRSFKGGVTSELIPKLLFQDFWLVGTLVPCISLKYKVNKHKVLCTSNIDIILCT